MSDPDLIFKTLRLVPDFDGNPHILPRFIHLCDQIASEYLGANPENALAKLCLINGILNKITGPAARIINSNGISEDWDSIKSCLINNFSDQRDETALYNDLMLVTQGNSSPQEFYDRCLNLFSTIMTYVTLHEDVKTTIEAKRTLYRKLTMQAFVRGLKEPLGSRVRCMRPDSVEKALEFVQEELNVLYLQNRQEPITDKKSNVITTKTLPMAASTDNASPMSRTFNARAGPIASYQPLQTWRPNFQVNRPIPFGNAYGMPSHSQQMYRAPISHTQQMFRAAPPNYNRFNNNFQVQPRIIPQNSGPKPMSGISHYIAKERPSFGPSTTHDWRNSGNPPPSNYFKTKEMNMNVCLDDGGQYYYYPEYSIEPDFNCYLENPEYYNIEPMYCAGTDLNPENFAIGYPVAATNEPEPSTSKSSNEQDFQKREKSDKLK